MKPKNILRNLFIDIINNHYEYKNNGLKWYQKANRQIKESAMDIGVDVDLYSKIVAILSPYNRWENNISDAYKLLFCLKFERDQLEKLTFTTFRNNVEKAIDVYDGKVEFELTDTNMKTYSFYRNLMLDSNYVTIDRWMLKLLDFNKYFGKTLTSKRYNEYSLLFHDIANEFEIEPYEIQAIFWEYARNENIGGN
jgi:hypothetical protein